MSLFPVSRGFHCLDWIFLLVLEGPLVKGIGIGTKIVELKACSEIDM